MLAHKKTLTEKPVTLYRHVQRYGFFDRALRLLAVALFSLFISLGRWIMTELKPLSTL